MSTNTDLYFFVHIPKTAGMTFSHHITSNLSPKEYIHTTLKILEFYNRHIRTSSNNRILETSSLEEVKLTIFNGQKIPEGVSHVFSEENMNLYFSKLELFESFKRLERGF